MRRFHVLAAAIGAFLFVTAAVAQVAPGPGPLPTGTAGTKNVGVSVNDPGTGSLEALRPVQTLVRTNYTFASVDLQKLTRRSNAGAAMADVLPAVNLVGMANGAIVAVSNVDATANDTLTAGFGTTINGASTLIVPPGTSVVLTLDLPNTNWVAATSPGAGGIALLAGNNLSDVVSVATSRTNLGAAKSGANTDITSLGGLTTPLSVGQGGTNATTADAAHGQLNTPPTNDTTWTAVTGSPRVFNGNGTVVSTSGTTTTGLQEAINNALTGVGTQGQDLAIRGQDITTGGAWVTTQTTTLNFPPAQGKKIRMGSLTLDPTSALGASPGLTFDSQEMTDFSCDGCQDTYAGTGDPLDFAPTNGTPLDHGVGIVDSRFHFTTAPSIAFTFPTTNSFAANAKLEVQELNGDNSANWTPHNADLFVANATNASNNYTDMYVESQHIHGIKTGGWGIMVGTAAPNAGAIYGHSTYNIHIAAGDHPNANGIDTWESGSLYFGTIEGVTAGNTSLKFESGACGNIAILSYNSNWSGLNDASGCSGSNANLVIGNGGISADGIPAVFAKPGQLPATATNDSAPAGDLGQYMVSTVAAGSAISLTNTTAADITSITLTPGDWDVTGVVAFVGNASTTVTELIGAIGTTANTLVNDPAVERRAFLNGGAAYANGSYMTEGPSSVRYTVAANTTIYLIAWAQFGTSTQSAYGSIWARRAR